jgi:hypothetical protein
VLTAISFVLERRDRRTTLAERRPANSIFSPA